jgi:hypothetical protein
MQRYNDEFDAKGAGWLRRTLAPWAVVLAAMVTLCLVLTLDASFTSEQRTVLFQQSGFFP